MQDEWTGRSLVEYYVCAGVGARLVPQRPPHSQMQPPGPPPRARPPSAPPGAPGRPAVPRPFPDKNDRFEASVVARFPEQDRPTTPFPRECPEFCFPDGIRIVSVAEHQQDPMPVTNSFILTTGDRTRVYGVCITWMDALDPELVRRFVGEPGPRPPHARVYAQQAVCLISRVPAFELLALCCRQLYRLHITRATMPLERAEVQPALDARVAPPAQLTRLTLGGLSLEVPTPGLLEIPRSMATAADWLLVTKCLDAHNLLAVWALLLAEQKVLLLSAHTHVLTMACETLVATLYPFRWEHVYVPVLPSRLANFLHAPVPFLVGATPDVIHATDEVPSDVVQVHLDNNTVVLDTALYRKLRLPPRAKRKLLRKLALVCRPPGAAEQPLSAVEEEGGGDAVACAGSGGGSGGGGGGAGGAGPPASDGGAVAVGVHGRLVSAFQLPPHPEDAEGSEAGGYDSDGTEAGDGPCDYSLPATCMRTVKAAFLRFFTSALEKLPELYVMPPANVSARAVALDFFDGDRLIASHPEQCREWLAMVTRSQAFTEFLHERLTNDGCRLEIAFFNESVDAKRNRSRRTLTKRATPLLSTGRLPTGYASRAPPLPVRSMYERLCAAVGRSRPSPSTRVAVLVIGGPAPGAGAGAGASAGAGCGGGGGRDRGRAAGGGGPLGAFLEGVRKEFARELLWTRLSDAPSGLEFCAAPGPALATAHAARLGGSGLEDAALREAIFDLEAMAGARSAARAHVRAAVAAGLAQLSQLAGAHAPLCVVALGVVGLVGLELLAEIQQADEAAQRAEEAQRGAAEGARPGVGLSASGTLTTALQRGQTLAAVATLGVPLGAWDGGRQFGLRVPAPQARASWPHLRGGWTHFFHRDDTLGVPIRALCTGAAVRELEVRSRPPRRSGAPKLAAGAELYLQADAREVAQPLARALSEVWQDANIVSGAADGGRDAEERPAHARC